MKVLHLCSYYIGSRVHRNLFVALAKANVSSQNVWVPIRREKDKGINDVDQSCAKVTYTKCLSLLTRYSFSWKLLSLLFAVRRSAKSIGLGEVGVIHAHTLYSDGFLAFILSRIYSVPYVVSVRSTDVNIFERILPHWKWLTRIVLKKARCVLFISPAHQKKIEKYYGITKRASCFFGSAIDVYWINSLKLQREILKPATVNALYVGVINKNKNIRRAITAFFSIDDSDDKIFTVIGGTYAEYQEVFGPLPITLKKKVIFLPRVDDQNALRKHFSTAALLVMPSHFETFGLVYMEAVSQCVPVVYSKDQGIDGLYAEGVVGFNCDPKDVSSIASAIFKVLKAFPEGLDFSGKENPAINFCWASRADFLLKSAYS